MCSQQRLLIDSRKTQESGIESLMNNYLSGPPSPPPPLSLSRWVAVACSLSRIGSIKLSFGFYDLMFSLFLSLTSLVSQSVCLFPPSTEFYITHTPESHRVHSSQFFLLPVHFFPSLLPLCSCCFIFLLFCLWGSLAHDHLSFISQNADARTEISWDSLSYSFDLCSWQ